MNLKEIKTEFGDCDWMRAFLNGYTVDAILWLMNRVEELEKEKNAQIEAGVNFIMDTSFGGN